MKNTDTEILTVRILFLLPEPIRSQCTLSLSPENISFLIFSRGRERVHWEEQMG